jgi:hypothetical protein
MRRRRRRALDAVAQGNWGRRFPRWSAGGCGIDPANTQTVDLFLELNQRSIPMASHFRDVTLGDGRNSLRETLKSLGEALSGCLVRYRPALYLLSVAAVALGIALNWNWLTAAALFCVVAVLPCALMMFRCVRHGTCGAGNEAKAHPDAGQAN